ncbi:hypothetical protein K8Z61_14545 [Nocardioides sp. TRM66260-LWL]|uniref:hypothetical protein n=1 Tax=Nocardioides sp. TRM66260-LWL TaxID=2874478 RepID=UPI001CC4E150|nr:hypothetical protein [Nocardioides sp. TRM66260-LWL]MBZ5735710.1 hypothetical protein [Nocardioides sp. TRM66260-LWL]
MSARFPAPSARPAATGTVQLVSVVLLVVAALAVRDGAAGLGWVSGSPWLPTLADRLDGRQVTASVLLAAGIVAAAIAVLLLLPALRPARRTHRAVGSDGLVWVSPRALAALAVAAVDRTPGVLEVGRATVKRRRVSIPVTVLPDHADPASVRAAAEANARAAVAVLDDLPVVVTLQEVSA